MIYLDNAATTRMFDGVIEKTEKIYREDYFNPSALYASAQKNGMESCRSVIAKKLGAEKGEIVFTSCASESNNWVFFSAFKNKKGSVVITEGEHPSVYEAAVQLKSKGYDVRFCPLTKDGATDLEKMESLIDSDTSLVSVMQVSNETGAVNDLPAVKKIIARRSPRALFHSDGVQAFCKTDSDIRRLGVDLYSVSAHKIGGPKGIGALFIKKGINLQPFIVGGGQEGGLRSGTENAAAVWGFAEAVKLFSKVDSDEIKQMRQLMRDQILGLKDVSVNGDKVNSGFILSLSIKGIKAEILQQVLYDNGIVIGTGSACSSRHRNNRVLGGMGVDKASIEGSIRISWGADSTLNETKQAAVVITNCINKLRG